MKLSEARKIIPFIKCQTNEVVADCKTQDEARAFHNVLVETRKLFICLHNESSTVDDVLDQVENKNAAAKVYKEISGKKWLL